MAGWNFGLKECGRWDILAAMGRIDKHFDKVSRKQTLNTAISWIACFSFLCCIGIFQIIKYAKDIDPFYLYAGICNVTIGTFSVWTGSQILHAVVRRLVAEARKESGTD
jgi:hypothetical protein